MVAHLDTFLVLVGHLDTSWHMILARCEDGFTEGMEMLEASRMDRTDVTQGDLKELCESGLGGNMRQEDVSFLVTPGEGSAHTPASVESASRTLTGFNISNIICILLHIFSGSNLVRGGNAHCSPVNPFF